MTDLAPPADRRALLIEAAAAVILDQGLTAARTRDVTARAGVGVGLLNHYFAWSELRALAVARLLSDHTAALLADDPGMTLDAYVSTAFAPPAQRYWAVWIEAADAAAADPRLAQVVQTANDAVLQALALRLARTPCPDAEGAALRILAAHDGLAGFVKSGSPPLDPQVAAGHLARTIALECLAPPPAT